MSTIPDVLILPLNVLTSNRVHPAMRGGKSRTSRYKERITSDQGPEFQDLIVLTLEVGDR